MIKLSYLFFVSFKTSTSLVGIGPLDFPPSKQCGGRWGVGGRWKKSWSVVKYSVPEVGGWKMVGGGWWFVLSLLGQFLPGLPSTWNFWKHFNQKGLLPVSITAECFCKKKGNWEWVTIPYKKKSHNKNSQKYFASQNRKESD